MWEVCSRGGDGDSRGDSYTDGWEERILKQGRDEKRKEGKEEEREGGRGKY